MPANDILLPQNLEAEKCFLGACLLSPEDIGSYTGEITPEDFSVETNRKIWRALLELFSDGKQIDRVTLANQLIETNQLALITNGLSYLCDLDASLPQAYGIEGYAEIVKRKSVARRLIVQLEKARVEVEQYGDTCDVMERIPKIINDLDGEILRGPEMRTAIQVVDEAGGINHFLTKAAATIPTPFMWLNNLLNGGLRPGQLALLAARPGRGKTSVSMQFARAAGIHGKHTAVFSLETPSEDIVTQLACIHGRIDSGMLFGDEIPPGIRNRFTAALGAVNEWPIYFDDAAENLHAIAGICRRMKKAGILDFVIIDYLQLIKPDDRAENQNVAIGKISRALKLLAKELMVPFLVLSQLRRPKDNEENVPPNQTHLRDSGSLEQDADLIFFLHCLVEDMGNMRRDTRFMVEKHRKGRLSSRDMVFDCPTTQLEMPTHPGQQKE